ncbi:nucleoside-diphosphate sugar epimerase [Phenylobacterium sp. Root77]|uniref:mitochondrial fission ELM1 family protein n=1 Tax=unclassified Phenylobacterium TaxID=2640670 RepID=UPI0006F39D44|nr:MULTISPECIES: mitochondrial fission ELM1 family protein [unclassified Phenylobacterium]KQW68199.1 nucleoside-diphosphate sugar epimerase [Phenylobacterium sp. Root1277]KQW91940.1 nucleoside-diphosphate sugar epimerase [Phenylobacterium sp. Root1290]KRC40172.1 nucleoside-diphosphate sugar epimerase [Phenylobacterium sp. Root77]
MPDPQPTPVERPLTIWAVSDGRAGIEAQVVGLANAIARKRAARIVVKKIGWKSWIGRLPWWLTPFPRRFLTPESDLTAPWPDIWIAAGRATLPLSIRVKRWSGRKTYVVQVQDPRMPTRLFDLVIPPRHDRLEGDNVFPITGSPGRVNADRMAADLQRFEAQLDALPRPRVAVIIGGKSKAHDISPERAAAMAREIELPVTEEGGSVMVSFTRRTPAPAQAILEARLKHLPGVIWNGEGDNPYFAYLAAADYILVTEDSTNLATDAASTGKPVFVMKMDGESLKFGLFHEDLERLGAARPFGGAFHRWTYEPLAETERAADEVLRRFDARKV